MDDTLLPWGQPTFRETSELTQTREKPKWENSSSTATQTTLQTVHATEEMQPTAAAAALPVAKTTRATISIDACNRDVATVFATTTPELHWKSDV